MGRYTGEYPGYDAALVVSLRAGQEGGGLRGTVDARFRNNVARFQSELLLIVHGYNNNAAQAEQAYTEFRAGLARRLPASATRLADAMGDVFWPGDAKWSGPLDELDFLFYPKAVENGLEAVPLFAKYLRGRRDVQIVHMVGHSMGCRVVLELIRELRSQRGGPAIGKVCLMAAAVPTFKVSNGGSLYDALRAAKEALVLWSTSDPVLEYAFPPGQTLARGEEGFFPEALGRKGDVPSNPGQLTASPVPGATHSDYWGVRRNAATEKARGLTAAFLSEVAKGRATPAREVASGRRPPSRDVGGMREISARP